MYEEVFHKKTKLVFGQIAENKFINNFYLAGGTALALQFGHRKSIDLDWFSPKPFSTKKIKESLKKIGELEVDSEQKDTLNCRLNGVKLSFFEYPYKVLFPFIEYSGINVANFKDIACMKLDAISSRGSKKDFIDLYFLLKEISLDEILNLFDQKYKEIKYNKMHLLKSLTYFEEAEEEPMPKMIKEVKWGNVKREIARRIKNY
jgi:predicted nucleotidyltransferase component of viral defense system